MKLVCAHKPPTVLTNYTHAEFVLVARALFPQPSAFMEEFLTRYEELSTFEEELNRRNKLVVAKNEFDCPACGAHLTGEESE